MKKLIVICAVLTLVPFNLKAVTKRTADSIKLLNNLAIECYLASNLIDAEHLFIKALKLAKENYTEQHYEVAEIQNNLAVLYLRKWNYDQAIEYIQYTLNIFLESEDIDRIANAYSNLGRAYRLKGEYEEAHNYLYKALTTLDGKHSPQLSRRKIEVFTRLSYLAIKKQEYQEAISFAMQGIEEGLKEPQIKKTTYYSLYLALSECYSKMGDYDSTIFFLNKYDKLITENAIYSEYQRANLFYRIAECNLQFQKAELAMNAITEAEFLFQNSPIDSIFHTRILVQKARYYELTNNYSEAIRCYNQANNFYIKRSRMVSNSDYASSIEAISLLKKRTLCYQMWYTQTNNYALLDTTLIELKKISELIDRTRKSYLGIESKLRLTEAENGIYNMGISCSHALYRHTQKPQYLNAAFYFTSKSKSAVLLENLNELNAKQFSGISAHIHNTEKELKQQEAYLKQSQYSELSKATPNAQQLEKLQNKLFKNFEEQQNLNEVIKKTYPDLHNNKNSSTKASIKLLQQKLKRNESLLEYHLTDSALFVHCIDKHTHKLFKTTIDSLFYTNLDNLIAQHTLFDFKYTGANVFTEYQHLANELYRYLFPQEMRANLKKQLIIVPDGKISYLPFESLVCSKGSEVKSFAYLDYLFLHHEMSYAYSSLITESNSPRKRQLNNKLLALAPEYNNSTYGGEPKPTRNILTPLPYAKKEVRLIASIMQGDTAIGSLANSNYFKQEAGKYDVLHLAMHTSIDNKQPLFSKFLFSNTSTDFLNTCDIFTLDLNAGLAVLSACNTGDGVYKNGEGIMSLSRGFAYAGCPSTVLTLWQVEDKAAMKIMESFYLNMRKGFTKSKALDLAKKKYLKTADETTLHPFFWSSYILIGEKTPLYYKRRHIASLLFTLGLTGIMFWLFKRRVPQ